MRFNVIFSPDVPIHLKKRNQSQIFFQLTSTPNTNIRSARTLHLDEDMTLYPDKTYRAVPLSGRHFKIEEVPDAGQEA